MKWHDTGLVLFVGIVIGVYIGYAMTGLGRVRMYSIAHDIKNAGNTDGFEDLKYRLELRKRVGPQLARVSFGYSGCVVCKTPWSLVDGHTVYYEASPKIGPGRGRFSVCNECWKLMESMGMDQELVDAYVNDAKENHPEVVEEIRTAVQKELSAPRWISKPVKDPQ